MADEAKRLSVQIDTVGNTSGADAVKKSLDETKQAARAATDEASKPPPEPSFDEPTKGSEIFHEALRGIRRDLPELFHYAHLFINPITAIVGGTAIAFKTLYERIQETLKAMESADIGKLTALLEAQKDAASGLRAEMEAYNRALDETINKEQTVGEKANAAVEGIHRLARAQLELTDARKAAALAAVDEQEKTGALTQAAAIQKRLDIEKQSADETRTIKTKESKDALALKEQEYKDLQSAVAAGELAIQQKQEVAEAARIKLAGAPGRLEQIKKAYDEQLKIVEEAQKKVDKGPGIFEKIASPFPGAVDRQQLDRQREIRDRLKETLDTEITRTERVKETAAVAEKDLDTAKAKTQADAETLNKLETELETERQISDELTKQLALLDAINAKRLETVARSQQPEAEKADVKAQAEDEAKAAELLQRAGELPGSFIRQAASAVVEETQKGHAVNQSVMELVVEGFTHIQGAQAAQNRENINLRKQIADVVKQLEAYTNSGKIGK